MNASIACDELVSYDIRVLVDKEAVDIQGDGVEEDLFAWEAKEEAFQFCLLRIASTVLGVRNGKGRIDFAKIGCVDRSK